MAKANIYLTLSGDSLDFGNIEKTLKESPTKTRQKGEALKNGQVFRFSEWIFDSGIVKIMDISEIIPVFQRFEDKTDLMIEVAERNHARWSVLICVRGYENDYPTLYLPSSFISFAGKIGADIGFDNYILCAYT